jgi:quercetin dioxygenase-like cupin family protein
MELPRRDLTFLLPLLAAASADAQEGALPSRMYRYEDLASRPGSNPQNKSRPVFDGRTHTGARVEMHETELGPGLAPHPPHKHVHEELLIVREGTVEVTISGKSQLLGPGSVAYVASNEEHGWKNAGNSIARYYILTLRG